MNYVASFWVNTNESSRGMRVALVDTILDSLHANKVTQIIYGYDPCYASAKSSTHMQTMKCEMLYEYVSKLQEQHVIQFEVESSFIRSRPITITLRGNDIWYESTTNGNIEGISVTSKRSYMNDELGDLSIDFPDAVRDLPNISKEVNSRSLDVIIRLTESVLKFECISDMVLIDSKTQCETPVLGHMVYHSDISMYIYDILMTYLVHYVKVNACSDNRFVSYHDRTGISLITTLVNSAIPLTANGMPFRDIRYSPYRHTDVDQYNMRELYDQFKTIATGPIEQIINCIPDVIINQVAKMPTVRARPPAGTLEDFYRDVANRLVDCSIRQF